MAFLSYFELLVSNPGLDLIAETILLKLDIKSLAKCRLVSKKLNQFIDSKRSFLSKELQEIVERKISSSILDPNNKGWKLYFDNHHNHNFELRLVLKYLFT